MEFHFPTKVLKPEDYAPVQVLALKEYYKNYFNSIINEVNHIFLYYIFILKVRKKKNKKIIYRPILSQYYKYFFNQRRF